MRALDDLRLFSHLASSLHFGRTAAECHVTQPTLSRVISRIEADVGTRLFDRDRRTVELTPDGIRFRAFAEAVQEAWDRFDRNRGDDAEVTGTLSVFCTVTASQSIVPELLRRFRAAHPAVRVRIETGYATEAFIALSSRRVDVAVAALTGRPPRGVRAHRLASTSLLPVLPGTGEWSLSRRPGPSWSTVPWVLPTAGLTRTLTDQWFRRLHVRPSIAAEANGHEAVLTLVALGCGVGIVPRLVAERAPSAGELSVVDVANAPVFDISACTLPDNFANRAVAALWETLGADRGR